MVRVLHATKQHMLGSSKCFLHTSHKTIRQFYDVSRHRRGEDNRRKYCSFDFHINWRRHFRCTMHCAIRSSHCLRSAAGIWAWFCVALDAWTGKNVSAVGPKELQARHMSTNHNFAHGKMATSSVSFFSVQTETSLFMRWQKISLFMRVAVTARLRIVLHQKWTQKHRKIESIRAWPFGR